MGRLNGTKRIRKGLKRRAFAYPYLVWMVVLILAPMLLIAYYAFTGTIDGRTIFTLEHMKRAFEPIFLGVLGHSLAIALAATLICLALGFPIAWQLSKMPPRKSAIISIFFILPMWMNFLLRTYAWMALLDTNGLVNSFLKLIGVGPVMLLYNTQAIVTGMVYNYIPFMILPIYNVLQKIPRANIEAAQDLGANDREVFSRVILPLSVPGVVSGVTMVFIPSITTFAISRLLGGSQYMLYGDLIQNQFIEMRDWNFGSALSLILLGLVFLSMWVTSVFDKGESSGALL